MFIVVVSLSLSYLCRVILLSLSLSRYRYIVIVIIIIIDVVTIHDLSKIYDHTSRTAAANPAANLYIALLRNGFRRFSGLASAAEVVLQDCSGFEGPHGPYGIAG